MEVKIKSKEIYIKNSILNKYIIIIYKSAFIFSLFLILKNNYFLTLIKKNNKFESNFYNKKNNIIKNLNKETYIKYIDSCKSLKRFNINKIKKENPFLSICISIYNSEKYIEMAILSVINQSFQDFEIIIVNDFSNDKTYNIITKLQNEDNRIRIFNNTKNLGYLLFKSFLRSKFKRKIYIIFRF